MYSNLVFESVKTYFKFGLDLALLAWWRRQPRCFLWRHWIVLSLLKRETKLVWQQKWEQTKIAAYVWRDDRRCLLHQQTAWKWKPQERNQKHETISGHSNRKLNYVYITISILKSTEMYFNATGKINQQNQIWSECKIDWSFWSNNWAICVNFDIMSRMFREAYMLYRATHNKNKMMVKVFVATR